MPTRQYTPEQMMAAFSTLIGDNLLLPDSLHAPLYKRGNASGKCTIPRSILAAQPQQPVLLTTTPSGHSSPRSGA